MTKDISQNLRKFRAAQRRMVICFVLLTLAALTGIVFAVAKIVEKFF